MPQRSNGDSGPTPSSFGSGFVGRELEMPILRAGVDDAVAGRGRWLLLAGDPGMGKTRTCEEVAAYADDQGARVLWGRCYEGAGAPAFWPWVQIIRSAVDKIDTPKLNMLLAASGPDLAQLVPEIRQRVPDLPTPPLMDPDHARERIFDSISRFLLHLAQEQPVVVIIDDLQGADLPSALLVQFIAQSLGQQTAGRLLLMIACRTAALTVRSPLGEVLAALAQSNGHAHLDLGGLSQAEVAGFVGIHAGVEPLPEVVEQLYRVSEGNPLFLGELVQVIQREGGWSSTGRTGPLPATVTAVIGRRLAALSPACRELLGAAAVVGRDFRSTVIAEAVVPDSPDSSATPVADLLDEGVQHHIIGATWVHDVYRFSHVLMREALYAELVVERRQLLHRRVAEILQRRPDTSELLTEIAQHCIEAGGSADLRTAVVYAQRAAERALALFAYEEAVRLAEVALAALDRLPGPTDLTRCELFLTLAHAQKGAVDTDASRATFQRAVELARTVGASELFARAVLGTCWRLNLANTDADSVRLLEEAIDILGPHDSVLRAKVLSALANELLASQDVTTFTRSAELSREAVAVARRVGDPPALCSAVQTWMSCAWVPENLDERLAAVNELIALGEAHQSTEITAEASRLRLGSLFELGDLAGVDRELERFTRCATALRLASWLYWIPCWHSTLATFRGHFADAERFALEAAEIGQRAKEPRASQMLSIQMGFPLLLTGKIASRSGRTSAKRIGDMNWNWGVRTALLHGARAVGDGVSARAQFEALAEHDFTDVPHTNRLLSLAVLAEFAAHFNDRRRASLLYPRLLPFKTRNVPSPSWGSVARFVALAASTLGRVDEAARHFEDAIAHNARMGTRPHLALTETDYASVLLERDAAGDRARAVTLLQNALATANELGMIPLRAKIEALEDRYRLSRTEPTRRVEVATSPRTASDLDQEASGSERPVSVPPFVGREREIGVLGRAAADVLAGRGRLVLLAGEPGIGKTRTAEKFANIVGAQGARVLWGRCYENEGAPAFWPWLQVLRACAKEFDADALRQALGTAASDVAQLVPAVRERLPDLAEPSPSESPEARFRLFDGVARFLGRATHQAPLVIILEDLHGADRSSLALLEFLTRQMREVPTLVVGTYRDVGVTSDNVLSEALVDLIREPATERLTLRGLSRQEIGRYVEASLGEKPSEALVIALHQRTEGNPLFVTEFVQLLRANTELTAIANPRSAIAIPESVKAAIARRLAPLSAGCNEVMRVASVIGREFRVDVLEGIGVFLSREPTGHAVPILGAIAEAVAACAVVPVPGSRGGYRFAHALIREALYDEISPILRAQLHREVGEAIERVPDAEEHLAELAYHFFEGSGEDDDKAVSYAVRAADRAVAVLAYEEATRLYETGLSILKRRNAVASLRGCELLLGLGAAYIRIRDVIRGKRTLQHAADIARQLQLPEQMAKVSGLLSQVSGSETEVADRSFATSDSSELALEPETTDQRPHNLFRSDGDYWTIAFEGSTFRLKDSKGLQYVAHLLRHPGREFHVLDLAAQHAAHDNGGSAERNNGIAAATEMPLLDSTAKAQYKRRVEDLREELLEAERNNDRGRAESARAEMDLIGEQLAAAVGLGGRDRTAARDAERARLAVTKRIKATLMAIRQLHPGLARYLSLAIKTGYFCTYQPAAGAPVLRVV